MPVRIKLIVTNYMLKRYEKQFFVLENTFI